MLDIRKKIEKQSAVVTLEGRLDSVTAADLEAELKGILDEADELTLDFAGLSYISSAGLRILLSAQKVMSRKGGMKIIHVSDMIMEVFEVTGFADILTIQQ